MPFPSRILSPICRNSRSPRRLQCCNLSCWFLPPPLEWRANYVTPTWAGQTQPLAEAGFKMLCPFWSIIWVIVLLEDPWPLTETQQHWALHCAPKFFGSLQISWCHAVKESGARSSKETQNLCKPPPCLNVGTMFFYLKASFCFL